MRQRGVFEVEKVQPLAEDLRLKPDEVLKSFAFTGARIGDQVVSNMPADGSQAWFGKTPPDLSLEARAKGPDWIYNYLKSFYVDPTTAIGWNNTVFPNASMPNPLWELQGIQIAHHAAAKEGEEAAHVTLEITQKGRENAAQFDETARDVTAFLTYVAEPAALQRTALGVWVLLFLVVFTFLAWMLKLAVDEAFVSRPQAFKGFGGGSTGVRRLLGDSLDEAPKDVHSPSTL